MEQLLQESDPFFEQNIHLHNLINFWGVLNIQFNYLFQESAYYTPLTFNTGSGEVTSYNVTGLAPDTKYTIQVAALTRRGDGTRSQPAKVKTPGGVPSRPNITPR